MTKSKSKTFPKGTDSFDIGDWLESLIKLETVGGTRSNEVTTSKYIITVTEVLQETYKDKTNE